VVHALTANLLRPGGIYDNKGVLDAHPIARQLPTDHAPRTRVGGYPLLLLQAPGATLADEILTPGEGQLRALLAIHGDPARELPGGQRLRDALAGLDLLVALDIADTETTRLAHYVLPSTHPFERPDVHLHDTSILPYRMTQKTEALVAPPGEARDEAEVLAALMKRVGPSLRKGVHGPHLRVLGAYLSTADLAAWEDRLLDGSGQVTGQALADAPHGWFGGEVNRATWRVTTPTGKFELLPAAIATELARLEPPKGDLRLLTSAARDPALRPFDRPRFDRPGGEDPGVTLHPSLGFAEGATVRVRTDAGAVTARVHLDDTLRPDTVDFPAGYAADVLALVPTDLLDPLTGTPALNGLACRIEAV
jgi:formate dehydrogenase